MRKTLVVVLLLLSSIEWGESYRGRKIVFRYTESEGLDLVNQLLKAVDPSLPENFYFPATFKERIRWVYAETNAHRLRLAFTDPHFNSKKSSMRLMAAGYDFPHEGEVLLPGKEKIPVIEIKAGRLMAWIRYQHKTQAGFNQMEKNTFAALLAHEAVHLEREDDPETEEAVLEEELRAWSVVSWEITRPLRAAGEPLEIDLIEADDILRKCGDQTGCSEFRDYIRLKTPSLQKQSAVQLHSAFSVRKERINTGARR
jgi:hypothetical protein